MTYSHRDHERISNLSGRYFLTIFVTAFLVRVLCMIVLQSWELPDQWQFGYEIGKLGKSLAEGHGFSISNNPTAKYPPVYPLLVGGIFALFGVYSKIAALVLFMFQSICSAFIAVCLAILGNRFFGQKEGIISGFIWCLYPSSIFYSAVRIWYSEFAIMLLFLLIIIATSDQLFLLFSRVIGLGSLGGILILTNSTMAIYTVLLLILMLSIRKIGVQRGLMLLLIWCFAVGIVMTPWATRNYVVLGTPRILKSNFGLELFFGNNPYSSSGRLDEEREKALEALNKQESAYYKAKSEYAYYGYLQDKAFEWIRMNPVKFLQLTGKRFWYFWGKFPSSGPGIWSRYSCFQLVWYIPVILLAVYGTWHSIRHRWNLGPVWLFLLIYPLPFYVTHVQLYRYRYPVEPFLVLLAAIPLNTCFEFCWGKLKRRGM